MLWPTAAAFSRVAARMPVDMLPAMQPAGPRAVADIILRSLNIDDLSLPASAAVSTSSASFSSIAPSSATVLSSPASAVVPVEAVQLIGERGLYGAICIDIVR